MKSLLSILKTEDQIMQKINSTLDSIDYFTAERKRISRSPFECEAKKSDIDSCDRLTSKYREDVEEYKQQLESVRKELREYLEAILN